MPDKKPDRDQMLDKAYTVETNEEVEQLYREWADRYDTDTVGRFGYVAPKLAADAFARHSRDRDRPVSTSAAAQACRVRPWRRTASRSSTAWT